MTGLHLAQYRIDAELGRGGMGIVYRAHDTKLDRAVAIKVLPAAALASEDDRSRFLREAKAAAQLSHPNVCHVYQVDEALPLDADGGRVAGQDEARLFIAMEFIDGETLGAHIARGPFKLATAVNIAAQVAEALRVAHAKQIVHRDIKSANVMLTKEGTVKVLDFGLAKTTASTMLTRLGSTVGTVAYMSPEQARGQDVDGRSDLYSLGTVLYEMVAGRLPFAGDYEQAVVYGILNENPEPLTAVRTGVPIGLEWIVNKLLAKEPRHRYQTAADLVADLETVDLSGSGNSRRSMATPSVPAPAAEPRRQGVRWLIPAAIGLVSLAIGLATGLRMGGDADGIPRTVQRLSVDLRDFRNIQYPALSRDGEYLAFVAVDSVDGRRFVFVREQRTGVVRRIEHSAGGRRPTFSPDGRWLLFGTESDLRKVLVNGGTLITLVQAPFAMAAWGPDGSVVYESDGPLRMLDEGSDQPRIIAAPDTTSGELYLDHPWSTLDGRYLLYTVLSRSNAVESWLYDFRTQERRKLLDGVSQPRFAPSGHLLYSRGSTSQLMARPFDIESGASMGDEVPLAGTSLNGLYSFSQDGMYVEIGSDLLIQDPHLVMLNVTGGTTEDIDLGNGAHCCMDISTDGRTLVAEEHDLVSDAPRIWAYDTEVWGSQPVSDASELAVKPRLADDGRVYYLTSSDGFGSCDLSSRRVDGSDPENVEVRGVGCDAYAVSRDGRFVVYTMAEGSQVTRIVLSTKGNPDSRVLYTVSGGVLSLAIDLGGNLVAASIRTFGRQQLIALGMDGRGPWPISEGEARHLTWARNGGDLVFANQGQIVRVPVTRSGSGVVVGTASTVATRVARVTGVVELPGGKGYIVSEFGDATLGSAVDAPVTAIVNWFEELESLAPHAR